ncbi:hypothetical protein [Streptomyces longwoodensis]|uniref:hypothetical protein n=1 Tax=Streptomyces longwoodensis TaxID=68231 RepID=UPI0022546C94|nr:hypothetical protein [Streptomyces longwoodensis]MCX5000896.1 hypothetical protein [Streptomyces longwoodensis]
MKSTLNPNGCRWCGIDQRGHGRQHTAPVGWHAWEQPTQDQIKQRMKARRAARLFATSILAGVQEWKRRSLAVVETPSRLFFASPDPTAAGHHASQDRRDGDRD